MGVSDGVMVGEVEGELVGESEGELVGGEVLLEGGGEGVGGASLQWQRAQQFSS